MDRRSLFRRAQVMLAVAAATMAPEHIAAMMSRTVGAKVRRGKPASYWKPNGAQECARRRRQIAAGILTESNGLVRGVA